MTDDRHGITNREKLGRKGTPASLALVDLPKRLTKKRARAPSYLRPKNIKGHIYYYWHREGSKEIYLGDADSVLDAVELAKKQKERQSAEET